MKKNLWRFVFLVLTSTAFAAESAGKPNIVVILADDYGWGSAVCYGATGVKTPNLDRLAREGLMFANVYAAGTRTVRVTVNDGRGGALWRHEAQVLEPFVDASRADRGRRADARAPKERAARQPPSPCLHPDPLLPATRASHAAAGANLDARSRACRGRSET